MAQGCDRHRLLPHSLLPSSACLAASLRSSPPPTSTLHQAPTSGRRRPLVIGRHTILQPAAGTWHPRAMGMGSVPCPSCSNGHASAGMNYLAGTGDTAMVAGDTAWWRQQASRSPPPLLRPRSLLPPLRPRPLPSLLCHLERGEGRGGEMKRGEMGREKRREEEGERSVLGEEGCDHGGPVPSSPPLTTAVTTVTAVAPVGRSGNSAFSHMETMSIANKVSVAGRILILGESWQAARDHKSLGATETT
uniref:Uncharacterized protein n=1 Tax=Oryza punctata TaxID=4537 RepID=A0A0E0KZY0_ORYPU